MMQKIKTDICIVGTGFSGTFTAFTLLGTSARILLVERGMYLSRDKMEENYFERNSYKKILSSFIHRRDFFKPQKYISLLKQRKKLFNLSDIIYDEPEFRNYEHLNRGKNNFNYSGRHAVGGNSLVWFGNAIRKVPNDFRTKSTYGFGVDWPLTYYDLEKYFDQAEKEMGVSGPPIDAFTPYRNEPFPYPPFQLPPGAIELNRLFKGTGFEITPSHKARLPIDSTTRAACCGAGTCLVFCPADARYNCLTTHLETIRTSQQAVILDQVTISRLIHDGDRITEAVAFDRKGNEIRIQAEIFILAANAIENARILLLSQFHYLDTGFKTRSKAIGKYLTDQVGLWITLKFPFNLHPGYEKTVQSTHSLSYYDGPFREQHSGIIVELFLGKPLDIQEIQKSITTQIKQETCGNELRKNIFLNSLGEFKLCLEMEMLPEERNCVTLNHYQKNEFGDPIAEFHFSIWDQEYLKRSRKFYLELFKKIVEGAGGCLGPVISRNSFDHMLGTCRMGVDPGESVVDENLKSHEHKNLYVVGGSAFPTAGINNPTLTIVALALRCGEYLRKNLKL
jgi:choline dehydrogenase-like flavoprotein